MLSSSTLEALNISPLAPLAHSFLPLTLRASKEMERSEVLEPLNVTSFLELQEEMCPSSAFEDTTATQRSRSMPVFAWQGVRQEREQLSGPPSVNCR